VAHQVGGGLGGFLDLGKAVLAVGGVVNVLGKKVGVGGNHAKKIVKGVRNCLGAADARFRRIGKAKGGGHGGVLSGMRIGMQVCHGFEDGRQKGIGIERLERDAMRSTDIARFSSEIVHGRGIDGEDGKEWILGAELIDVMESLEIPGMNIESNGMPTATGENQKQFIERLGPMKFDAVAGGGR